MRRAARQSRTSQIVRFADFEVDLSAGQLRKGGARIRLQEQPFQVLAVLLQHSGEVVTREELRQRLWHSDTFVDFDNNLNTAINKIREALADSAEEPRFIETLPRRGYRFMAFVSPAAACASKMRQKRIDSLAVLPLVNETGLEETEYFSDGITETMIGNLAQLPLRVMSRSTVFRYKERNVDPQTAGRELNVRAVITGRVLKHGDQVSLAVEMVDVGDGAQLWSASYKRGLPEIFATQEQIATEICDKLRVRLTENQRKRLTKRHTQSTEAYQLYLMGRFHLARRTADSFKKSFEYFQLAAEHDPNYALPYAGLADAYLIGQYYGVIPPAVGLPKAKAAVARALQLDESLAEVHTTQGVILSVQDWDAEAGEKEFRHAIDLNRNYSTAFFWYGLMHLWPLGRFEEAEEALRTALEVDPFSLIINTHLAWILASMGKHEAAAEQLHNVLEMDHKFAEAHLSLAFLSGKLGNFEEGMAHARRGITLSKGDVRMRCYLAALQAAAGHKEEALAELQELLQLVEIRSVAPTYLSLVYVALGDIDSALLLLEKAVQERSPHVRFANLIFANLKSPLNLLQSNPRFHDLLRRMHLAP